jgi:DNA-binding NtrC family response regulator
MSKKVAVLVVDDEVLVRQVSVVQLEDAGYQVLEASSADEALSVLDSDQSIGVLFTDVNMPGELNGLELARLVHERWPAVRLILTSGRGEISQADMPDDGRFLPKPYSLGRMNALIDEIAKESSKD